ncbi:ABC transporter ATP-binding protein [Luteimicrobium subarcticum]|uniref:ABC-type quaternary amine transporter n=1 Tax=Luteimicrobium subarcticum TaxID=620910 RepID=A0A2M8WVQ6_9MICO|nr:ATP-binding cassette domain-containing protein [Luteimicrobium subarcticum]PJI95002.1 osmoprotectant transport system ATP-binding protein [Luteimicrobium subarcticum]
MVDNQPLDRRPGSSTSGRTAADDAIVFEHVRKEYADGTVAVGDLSLAVRRHEILALVGPSGCGKSTTLRMTNRLVEPTSGRIVVEGTDVTREDRVRLRRSMGYVIQSVGLFPHRTVAQNVATVPGLVGWDRRRARARASELLELVGLDPDRYGKRYPHELSGGEQQRVGVARALATDPPVLLMDEPFGAVDPAGRRRLQEEFHRIQRELGTTVMLVTHDIDEAVRLGDRVAVFSRGGVVEQLDDPVAVLSRPATDAVSDLVGDGAPVRLLGITRVSREDATAGGPPAPDAPVVRVGDTLAAALEAVAEASTGAGGAEAGAGVGGRVAVLPSDAPADARADHPGVLGTLDAAGVLAALRRAVEPEPADRSDPAA